MMNRLCCMRLNTAGVVIGWIGAAVSLITIIMLAIGLSRIDELAKAIMDQINDSNANVDNIRKGLLVLLTVYLTINLINMMASALLVAGTIKERHLMLVPWLLNSGISLCFGALYMIFFVIMAISTAAPFDSTVIYLISAGISLVFQWIIWYAIYSLFKTLQQSREGQQLLRPTGSTGSAYPSYTKI